MSQPADVCDAYYELYTSTWTDIAPGYYTVATVNGVTV